MSLPIKTCVSTADLPSSAGSLLLDTGSNQLLSRNASSPSLPSRTWLSWTNLYSLSTSWYKVKKPRKARKKSPILQPNSPPNKEEFCVHTHVKREWDEQISWIWGIQCSCLQEAITLQRDSEDMQERRKEYGF